jgi:hypothetical protein
MTPRRRTRALLYLLAILAVAAFAFGWFLFDYSERHGVSALPWLENHWRKP